METNLVWKLQQLTVWGWNLNISDESLLCRERKCLYYLCMNKTETRKNKILVCCVFKMNLNAINHSTIQKSDTEWHILCTIKTAIKKSTFSWLNLSLQSERTIQFMWDSARGTDFKASLGRRIKTNLWAMRPCCCNPAMCRTFIGVSSDQWKNGAAAVGTHTLTSVGISSSQPVSWNTFFSQLWWQMLFIAHFSCVITELYLSLHPYLQSKVIKPAPISRLYHCEQMLF